MGNVGGIYAPGIFTNGRYSRRTSDDMFSTVPLVPDNQVEREIVGGFGLVSDERNFGGIRERLLLFLVTVQHTRLAITPASMFSKTSACVATVSLLT